ncbi:hypothetical protein BKA93DRAFT_880131 [Sparassis latifolia]
MLPIMATNEPLRSIELLANSPTPNPADDDNTHLLSPSPDDKTRPWRIAALHPAGIIKRADKYQQDTLNILEESIGVMENAVHSDLHGKYDLLQATRTSMGKYGIMASLFERRRVVHYMGEAKNLNKETIRSSQVARSKMMWKQKGSGAVSPDSPSTEDTHRGIGNESQTGCKASPTERKSVTRSNQPTQTHLAKDQEYAGDDSSNSLRSFSDQHIFSSPSQTERHDMLQTEHLHQFSDSGYGRRELYLRDDVQ